MKSYLAPLAAIVLLTACAAPGPRLIVVKPTPMLAPQPIVVNGVTYPPLDGPARHPAALETPCYPDRADSDRKEGFVDFKFTIQPDGSPTDIFPIREAPLDYGFLQCAQAVFPHWKFKPDIVNGVPVETPGAYRFVFRLAK